MLGAPSIDQSLPPTLPMVCAEEVPPNPFVPLYERSMPDCIPGTNLISIKALLLSVGNSSIARVSMTRPVLTVPVASINGASALTETLSDTSPTSSWTLISARVAAGKISPERIAFLNPGASRVT